MKTNNEEGRWYKEVRNQGGGVYAVGGYVRDNLINAETRDVDFVVTGIPMDTLAEIMKSYEYKVDLVGKTFGVLKAAAPDSDAFMDLALPRKEFSTGPEHRDFNIEFDHNISIEQDLSRRDFTINAMAIAIDEPCIPKYIVDPFGGMEDIENKVIRTVGDPVQRFTEDPLRMLRAAQFAARFGFTIHRDTLFAMKWMSNKIKTVSPERVSAELIKMLKLSDTPSIGLQILVDTGLMQYIIPEFMDSIGFDQQNRHHDLTVDKHVFKVVDHAARRGFSTAVRVAALFHDISKPSTFSIDEDGRGHFFGHEKESAEVAKEIMKRLKFSASFDFPRGGEDLVYTLIRRHLVPVKRNSSDKSIRRWMRKVGEPWVVQELLNLRESDSFAHAAGSDIGGIEILRSRVEENSNIPMTQRDVDLDGHVISEKTGARGREIGDIKNQLLELIIAGEVENNSESLTEVLQEMFVNG